MLDFDLDNGTPPPNGVALAALARAAVRAPMVVADLSECAVVDVHRT
jgi:hypothetical protein